MANKKKTPDLRNLSDLRSIGPAALKDFKVLATIPILKLKRKIGGIGLNLESRRNEKV